MIHFTSVEFTWKGNTGTARSSDLTGGLYNVPSRFSITSTRTGKCRFYELDTNHPGYQNGWDGEFKVYTDNLFDGTKIVIFND